MQHDIIRATGGCVTIATIAELILEQGRQRAERVRQQGAQSAQMWQNLGQIVGQTVSSIQRVKADQARHEQITSLFNNPDATAGDYVQAFGDDAPKVLSALQGFQELQSGKAKDTEDAAKRMVSGFAVLPPETQAQFYPQVRQSAIQAGLVKPDQLPEQFDPKMLPAFVTWATGEAPQAPELGERDPTKDIYNKTTGEIVTPGAPAPERLTFSAPQPAMINGQRGFFRPGSDGQAYDMGGKPLDPSSVKPVAPEGRAPTYQWATDPNTNQIRLMTPEEIRRTGATQPKAPEPQIDVTSDVRTTSSGTQYIDLGDYQTPSEKDRARRAAQEAGIVVVSKEEGSALQSADLARANMHAMLSQIESKLPKDATGRIIVGPKNKLSKYLQTDADIAAFASWRAAAVQTIQALVERGMGFRLNQAEINMIMQNDMPQITDTYETAKRRIDNITTLLDHKEQAILKHDRRGLNTPQSQPDPMAGFTYNGYLQDATGGR